jgi:hypothetical protein
MLQVMKMHGMKFSPFLIFTVLCALLSCIATSPVCAQAGEEAWTFVDFTKYRDAVFIDKNSISYPFPNVMRVWAKISPSPKSKYYREARRELRKSGKSAKEFKYTKLKYEIDCAGNRIRRPKMMYFDSAGKEIHSKSLTEPKWKPISPGSLWGSLQNAVCVK